MLLATESWMERNRIERIQMTEYATGILEVMLVGADGRQIAQRVSADEITGHYRGETGAALIEMRDRALVLLQTHRRTGPEVAS